MWKYRTYLFASEEICNEKMAVKGWLEGTPPNISLIPLNMGEEGWVLQAAFRDMEPPAEWEGFAMLVTEGVPTLGPRKVLTMADYELALDDCIENTAAQKQYKSAASCASYVASTNPLWAAQAQAFIAWRDQTLEVAFSVLAAVSVGGTPPSVQAFLESFPVMVWPEET